MGGYLDRHDDKDGIGTGVEERDHPERGVVQLVHGRERQTPCQRRGRGGGESGSGGGGVGSSTSCSCGNSHTTTRIYDTSVVPTTTTATTTATATVSVITYPQSLPVPSQVALDVDAEEGDLGLEVKLLVSLVFSE